MPVSVPDLIVNILAGSICSLIAFIVGALYYRALRRDHMYIKRVVNPKDRDVDKLIAVYEKLMKSNYRSPATDIERWLSEYQKARKDPSHTLEEYWLIVKLNNNVISFLFFQYYTDCKLLFISYYGVDNPGLQTVKSSSQTMIEEMKRRLRRDLKDCRGIVYETAAPFQEVDIDHRRESQARNRLFSKYARDLGYQSYKLNISYKAPKISIDEEDYFEEEILTLSYIPIKSRPTNDTISKDEALQILSFVYTNVYGDSYEGEPEKSQIYKTYLSHLLKEYEECLPNIVQLTKY